MIDVTTGEISPLEWKKGTTLTLESVPVRDSIPAIADESYFDWAELPEAPSSLGARLEGDSIELSWEIHGGDPKSVVVERRIGEHGSWGRVAIGPATATTV